jgi:RNA polymerase subunit RPABC4/transcription elongation factor Spt4
MNIPGIILVIAGLISVFYGNNQNNSLEAQINSFFESGSKNPGTIFIILGVIGIIIGIVLIIREKMAGTGNYGNFGQKKTYNTNTNDKRCRSCNKVYSGSFSACPHCGSSLYEETNQIANSGDSWICKKCGEKNPTTSSSCKSCGGYK